MFKAHIHVNKDMDVAFELDKIASLADAHCLNDSKTSVLMRSAEHVLLDFKKQLSETASYGITMFLKKNLRTEDYYITIELLPRKGGAKKTGLLSRFLGR